MNKILHPSHTINMCSSAFTKHDTRQTTIVNIPYLGTAIGIPTWPAAPDGFRLNLGYSRMFVGIVSRRCLVG